MTAILRVEPDQLDQLQHQMIDPKATVDMLATEAGFFSFGTNNLT